MPKTDKELAIELVQAVIQANPRVIYSNSNNATINVPSITAEGVMNLIKGFYSAISNLDTSGDSSGQTE
jgi:hypothetical protein